MASQAGVVASLIGAMNPEELIASNVFSGDDVRMKAEEAGVPLTDDQVNRILDLVQDSMEESNAYVWDEIENEIRSIKEKSNG